MQGTSKVRSGRATKNRAPVEAFEAIENDEGNGEEEETVDALGGDEAEASTEREPPSTPARSSHTVMLWFLLPFVLVLLYGLLTR